MNCKICERHDSVAGPLEPSGVCIECERKIEAGKSSLPDPKFIGYQRELAPAPLAIIDRAVQLKMGADEIGKLVALHNGMEDRRAQQSFQRAMVQCQQELPTIVRDKANGTKKYASLDRINHICHPIYTKHGFYITFQEAPAVKDGWVRTVAEIGHEDGHRQTAYMELPRDGIGPQGNVIGGMNAVQGVCSTNTYAERRLMCRIFNITIANEDMDAESFIDEKDANEITRICQKVKMSAPKYALFLAYADVVPLDPAKPVWGDIRSIRQHKLAAVMDDLKRQEADFDRANSGGY